MKVLHAINRVTTHPLLQKGEGKKKEEYDYRKVNKKGAT